MKRNKFFLLTVAVLVLTAVSCTGNRLHLYNWSYYTPPR